LEDESVVDKPWQLTGEVTSQHRPVNSLLEEVFTFDHMTRATPTITEETTRNLEEIIKQRILDEVIVDVFTFKSSHCKFPRHYLQYSLPAKIAAEMFVCRRRGMMWKEKLNLLRNHLITVVPNHWIRKRAHSV